MASVASQLIEEVTAHAQSDSLEVARERCTDGTYFPNSLHTCLNLSITGRQNHERNSTSIIMYHFKGIDIMKGYWALSDLVNDQYSDMYADTLYTWHRWKNCFSQLLNLDGVNYIW